MSALVAPSVLDRLLQHFRAIVRAEVPGLTFLGTYLYSVSAVAPDGSTADVSPQDPKVGLPAIPKVPLRPGILGDAATLTVGSACHVRFVNGDPTRPIVKGSRAIPQALTIDASGAVQIGPSSTGVAFVAGGVPVARINDTIVGQFPSGVMTFVGSSTSIGPLPAPPAFNPVFVTITSPFVGSIAAGSPKVSTA